MSRQSALLVHGLARTSRSMEPMAGALRRQGFTVFNADYRSRSLPLEDLVSSVEPRFLEARETSDVLHLVGHSMGGLILRLLLRDHGVDGIGRAVFVGTPNQGSEVAGRFLRRGPLAWFYGPAGRQLGPDRVRELDLPAMACPFGVIAGTRRFHPFNLSGYISWTVFGFSLPNDGSVSVESTRLEGMADFVTVPVNHVLLPGHREVVRLTGRFLVAGSFGQ